LIAPDSHTEELDEVEADLDEDLSVQFKPGELECPLVGRWSFPIHWRFRPQQALNAFSANFLLSFSVSNRNNTFVYAQGDAVFYMRLHEEFGVTNTESLPSTATTFIEYSPLMDSPASASELDRAYSSPLGKISSARSSSDQNQLILEVHGINVPGKEITTDFVSMIESKLSNLTVNVISALLLRNPNLKLTIADLEFITGSSMVFGAQPQLPISLTFPAGFNHITQALNYFRQNIAVYLLPCSGSEAACFVKSRLNLLNQKHEERYVAIRLSY
jgi:hypothetical protein